MSKARAVTPRYTSYLPHARTNSHVNVWGLMGFDSFDLVTCCLSEHVYYIEAHYAALESTSLVFSMVYARLYTSWRARTDNALTFQTRCTRVLVLMDSTNWPHRIYNLTLQDVLLESAQPATVGRSWNTIPRLFYDVIDVRVTFCCMRINSLAELIQVHQTHQLPSRLSAMSSEELQIARDFVITETRGLTLLQFCSPHSNNINNISPDSPAGNAIQWAKYNMTDRQVDLIRTVFKSINECAYGLWLTIYSLGRCVMSFALCYARPIVLLGSLKVYATIYVVLRILLYNSLYCHLFIPLTLYWL